jgi:TPR repeat protein/S1-C subfamily serine protease
LKLLFDLGKTKVAMLRALTGFLCLCFLMPAQAKVGETVPQLVKRFGKSYTIDSEASGKSYRFRSEKVSVDILVANGVSVVETYFSDHPLTASGEPPNDIVRAILRINAPKARWTEIDAAAFGADYALRTGDGEYIATLKYTGPQPENTIWTMTVGLAKSLPGAANGAASTNWSSSEPTPSPSLSPSPTPSPPMQTARAFDPDAFLEFSTGQNYFFGDGVQKDLVEAVKWFRKAAERNYAPAQVQLGYCYAQGQGVPKDEVEGVKWTRKAAEQNSPNGQYNLAVAYREGTGVRKDPAEAVRWFRKAAEQNYASAARELGNCYFNGEGVRADHVEAVKWFRKAAQQNSGDAQNDLGICYARGQGVPKNHVEAVKWFRKAAEQNYGEAQVNLAISYERGAGVPKDYAEAVKWFNKAAEQDKTEAQLELGVCYAQGQGVPKDEIEAYKWFLLAAAKGNEGAKNNAAILERRMTRYEIAQGQKLARDFRPHRMADSSVEGSAAGGLAARPTGTGTGFFITDDGYLITNQHVTGNAAQVRLVTASGLISARIVKVDAANDLALLKAEGKLPSAEEFLDSKSETPVKGKFEALPVAASRDVKLGSTVVTVGFPNIGMQGFAPKFARGEIASLSGPQDDPRFFQISVPLQPGNSGGALVDEHGNVIGIVSAKLSASAALNATGELPENVNYAVKSSFLLSFLESVPEVVSNLKQRNASNMQSAELVEKVKGATVIVVVY